MVMTSLLILANNLASPLSLAPCYLPGLAELAECRAVRAPLFNEKPSAGALDIQFAVLRATTRQRESDPLFLLAGGPGQGARSYAPLVPAFFEDVRKSRDVVLVDVRGTGASSPLECPLPESSEIDLTGIGGPSDCRKRLGRSLSAFTTERQVRDLDAVRAALGYARLNLWGGSFGTRAALVYARLFPDRVRGVVLDGASPFENPFPSWTARDAATALERAFSDCEGDLECRTAYPQFRRDFGELLDRLERTPLVATAPHPRTGRPVRVRVDRVAFASTVKVMLYSPDHASLVPFVVARLKDGDVAPLLAAVWAERAWSTDTMALGLTLRIICAEELPRVPVDAAATASGTFLGRTDIEAWSRLCRDFAPDEPADVTTRPLPVPALILSGELDPVTPPRWGEAMRASFPRSAHVVVPGAGHNVSFTGCVPRLIARFIATADPAAVDPTCVGGLKRPPFVIGPSAARP